MKIFFATDHSGFELKNSLMEFVATELGHEVVDCGAFELNESDDYPDFVGVAVANLNASLPDSRAIILGKSGQGEAMFANRFTGIRAAVYYGGNTDIISLSREHNDANVLSLGAGFLSLEEAQGAVSLWLATNFSGEERHVRRINKFDAQTSL